LNVTSLEQQIYNCHLKHFRNGSPWKPRKDFSKIEESTLLYLRKLSQFFAKFKHINLEDFFEAPRLLHPEEPTPSLKYFTTRAAIKAYTLSQQQKNNQSPDKQLLRIKESFKFIINFCLEKKIQLQDYLFYKENYSFVWLEHYRTYQINPYCLMELLDFSKLSVMTENAVWEPNLTEHFFAFRNRYHQSAQAKSLIKDITSKIHILLKEELTSSTKTNII